MDRQDSEILSDRKHQEGVESLKSKRELKSGILILRQIYVRWKIQREKKREIRIKERKHKEEKGGRKQEN